MANEIPQDKANLTYEDLVLQLLTSEREVKKLKRQLSNIQGVIDSHRMITKAQADLSAAISAEKTRQETYLGMLLENCPDIIMLFDKTGRFAYCTDAFLKTAGIKNFGLINGRTFQEVFFPFNNPEFLQRFEAAFKKAVIDGESVAYNETLDMANEKNPRSYTMQIIAMRASNTEINGALALFHDLTDLLAAKQQAEQANNAKSDFLATVSHEIRTPMNAIMGLSDMMQKTPLNTLQQGYLKNIQKSSKILLNLINDILDFSKIEAGKLEIMNEYFDAHSMLHHLQSVLQVMFTQKNINFICNFEDNFPKVLYGDIKRIDQVLSNILNNALKYTNEGHVIFNAYRDDKGTLCFEIKDSGIGIKEKDLTKLFTAFEQFDKVKNKNIIGTGLGLAITRKLCELMNGTIGVSSKYGEGSVFTVKLNLPVGSEKDLVSDEKSDITFSAKNAKVLLVDDIEINLIVANAVLEEYSIVSDKAANGREAIEMVQSKDYDLVLMDHMMPEMDGVEATQRIRALGGKYLELPIVALTANAVSGAEKMFLNSGFNGFLSKPIDREALADCLLNFLPKNVIKRK